MADNYNQNLKEILQKEARKKYQNLPEEEKYKTQEKVQERYRNFTKEEKDVLY